MNVRVSGHVSEHICMHDTIHEREHLGSHDFGLLSVCSCMYMHAWAHMTLIETQGIARSGGAQVKGCPSG